MARVEQGESPKIQVVLNNTVASHMEASLSIQESLQMSIHTFAGSSTHRLDSLLARSLALWTQLSRAELRNHLRERRPRRQRRQASLIMDVIWRGVDRSMFRSQLVYSENSVTPNGEGKS